MGKVSCDKPSRPRYLMSKSTVCAIANVPNPGTLGLSEKPKPGSDGQTTVNPALVSGANARWNSKNEPGHPCKSRSGIGGGEPGGA